MDIHLHTPASSDYQEPQVTSLDILRTAEARGLDILAFTDHNTVAGYRRLQEEIAELELLERLQRLRPEEKDRLAEYRRLLGKMLVLPGFEFTATFGFHILGIFSPDTPVRDIEHLLLSLNVPSEQIDRGSATVGATADVLTAYRLISEGGGLAIAAHANSTNGVAMRGFTFGGQTKIAYTQDPGLCALEVTDLEIKGRRTTAAFFGGSKPEYPRRMHCIQGSDAHRLTRDPHNPKNLGIGERATDVLLEDASFEALKALLTGSDFARIRPHTAAAQIHFDPVQQARDEGSNIVQGFHESMSPRGGKLYAIIADVSAFANTNGGTLYIGLSPEPKQAPPGVNNPEQAVRELRASIDRMLTPRLAVTVDVQESRGKKVIRVMVPRGDDPPYAIENTKIYIRQEAETSLAVRDEIVQLVLRGHAAPAGAPAKALAQAGPEALRAAVEETSAHEAPAAEGTRPAPQPPARAAEAVGAPRTGVEIVATEDRSGNRYHTVRDLRNGSVIKNVTRASARKLWHYAITERESGLPKPEAITWSGDLGLIKKRDRGGVVRYDLVQRTAEGMRIYYGVTDDGVHGPWKRVVGDDERRSSTPLPAASSAVPVESREASQTRTQTVEPAPHNGEVVEPEGVEGAPAQAGLEIGDAERVEAVAAESEQPPEPAESEQPPERAESEPRRRRASAKRPAAKAAKSARPRASRAGKKSPARKASRRGKQNPKPDNPDPAPGSDPHV